MERWNGLVDRVLDGLVDGAFGWTGGRLVGGKLVVEKSLVDWNGRSNKLSGIKGLSWMELKRRK
ncbi:hypothetical protein BSKO_05392 [Bryopsis sp. KO-2023]|nr:hypothetical protein BSKO_05392 [Bryopsis sp. KO-2023]